jgi:hypothetical protein
MKDPVLKQIVLNLIYMAIFGLSHKFAGFEYTVILGIAVIAGQTSLK